MPVLVGSQILFDILVNQSFDDNSAEGSDTVAAEGASVEAVTVQSSQNEVFLQCTSFCDTYMNCDNCTGYMDTEGLCMSCSK